MKKKHINRVIEVAVILLILSGIVVLLAPTPNHEHSVSKRERGFETNTIPSVYSFEEMRAFFNEYLYTLYIETLPKHQYRIHEVQERYNVLARVIYERYTNNFTYSLVKGYASASRAILGGAWSSNGVPIVEIFVPAVMDVYRMKQQLGDPPGELELVSVIGLLHELDHLALGHDGSGGMKMAPFEKRVNCEKYAWALTCEHTIRPIVEKYRLTIDRGNFIYYKNWIDAGRNVNSPKWEAFIRKHYEPTR